MNKLNYTFHIICSTSSPDDFLLVLIIIHSEISEPEENPRKKKQYRPKFKFPHERTLYLHNFSPKTFKWTHVKLRTQTLKTSKKQHSKTNRLRHPKRLTARTQFAEQKTGQHETRSQIWQRVYWILSYFLPTTERTWKKISSMKSNGLKTRLFALSKSRRRSRLHDVLRLLHRWFCYVLWDHQLRDASVFFSIICVNCTTTQSESCPIFPYGSWKRYCIRWRFLANPAKWKRRQSVQRYTTTSAPRIFPRSVLFETLANKISL